MDKKLLVDKRMKYPRSLSCPGCQESINFHVIKNGVRYVVGTESDPQQFWNADLYRCPHCESLVLTDFGNRPQYTAVNSPERLPDGIENLADLITDEKNRGNLVFFSSWFRLREAA